MIGKGFTDRYLSEAEARELVQQAFQSWDLSGQRVLVVIPDGTRTMPMPLFFRLFYEALWGKVGALDYLVALGTHPAMSEAALNRMLGITAPERAGKFARVGIFNHRWDSPEALVTLGTISAAETQALSNGMLNMDVAVRINRMVLYYDVILVCGPVFPHEVAGFSGGSKYFFPGISGPEVINFTHWLGALITSYEVIGMPHNPVRDVIERAAAMIPTPRLNFCSVVKSEGLCGLYVSEDRQAWEAAASLSAQIHVRYVEKPYRKVFSQVAARYDDLWTGAKGMYKVEPVVAEGGEIILYAPHLTEVSYTHGRILDEVGYHVRDYFVKQWDRFQGYPWGVLAHSTHVRGIGTYEGGVERPRIQVTLATGIPAERCARINLGYQDPATLSPEEWAGREAEGVLFVPHAGETLYRLKK